MDKDHKIILNILGNELAKYASCDFDGYMDIVVEDYKVGWLQIRGNNVVLFSQEDDVYNEIAPLSDPGMQEKIQEAVQYLIDDEIEYGGS